MPRGAKAKKNSETGFKVEELLRNAVTSIQLGVEDYITSRDKKRPERCISAARNIYAGILLLFKYKIASLAKTPESAKSLIFVHTHVLPRVAEDGNVNWMPTPNGKNTIDSNTIKDRLESLNIYHDWGALAPLRGYRNDLEHLHPTHPVTIIQASISALFPMLKKFITDELHESPSALLGEAWTTMLTAHELFKDCEDQIAEEWERISYPLAALEFLKTCNCNACYSPLLRPHPEDVANEVSINSSEFRLTCFACGQTESASDFLSENFSDIHEDPFRSYGEDEVQECNFCHVHMLLLSESSCYWCGQITHWPKCTNCERPIDEQEAHRGATLCERCAMEDSYYQNEHE
ncbi:hypothetical protein [Ectopseudomonas khazarica]|uniref:hypothetical protein n=1 Tax=Ectopseudomonas khazarica TaxID=2502979 RepID=UPI00106DE53F|nr:hypothetical protein [Pseudomonas khazarica]